MSEGTTRAALVASGAVNSYSFIRETVSGFDMIVAVDGGLYHCHKAGIKPDLIIGDFDSVSSELLAAYPDIEKKRHPKEKDETDLELALNHVISLGIQDIVVFAALEYRSDHTLGNFHLLRRYPNRVHIESETESICIINQSYTLQGCSGKTISLLPIGEPVTGVNTRGLKWELKNASLTAFMMSISNICEADNVSISVEHGDILLCLQKKLDKPDHLYLPRPLED